MTCSAIGRAPIPIPTLMLSSSKAINVGGGVDGIDGSVPGPTSHSGGDSGVIASKTGFVDFARKSEAQFPKSWNAHWTRDWPLSRGSIMFRLQET